MKKLRLLIIDDHRLVRDGIKAMLRAQTKYKFDIEEAECGEAAIKLIIKKDFDIILADYQLPDIKGPDTISRILVHKPKSKILAISSYDELACVQNMINAGALGYVLKNISPTELINAFHTIIKGKKYFSNDVLEKMISHKEEKKIVDTDKNMAKKLHITKRQIEVLKLVASGLTNEAISKKLNLSKRTIDGHRQHLLEKLEVTNTAALIKKATELTLI